MGADYSPQQVLSSSTDQWMMVDKSAVSLDGTACNKVGTSYFAFQYQTVSHANDPAALLAPNVSLDNVYICFCIILPHLEVIWLLQTRGMH